MNANPAALQRGAVMKSKRPSLRAKPENTKERTMQTERAELYFRQGSSDKVYPLTVGERGRQMVRASATGAARFHIAERR
jgi:hypothetical protein